MPITKGALKKLRHDVKRTQQRVVVRRQVRDAVKKMRQSPTKKTLALVFHALDSAATKKIIHPNKAARLKSRLTKLLAKK